MGCKDKILPEPLLKNFNVNCLTYEKNVLQPYNDNLCLFRALALHLHGNKELEGETSNNFNLFLKNKGKRDPSKFKGVHMTIIPEVKILLQLSIFLCDIDFVDAELIAELRRTSFQKFEKSVKLLRYNIHICCVNNNNALFKAFRCTTCDTIFSKTGKLERHLFKCLRTDRNAFWKMDAFNIPHRSDQKLFENLAILDFESICVKQANSYKQTETTTWIGKHVPKSVSISSNLIPFFSATPIFIISSRLLSVLSRDKQLRAKLRWNWIFLK